MVDEGRFLEQLDKSSIWRKKELLMLATRTAEQGDASLRFSTMRALVVLFCAHCEGFLKDAVGLFIDVLEDSGLDPHQLKDVFIILLNPEGEKRTWRQVKSSLLGATQRSPIEARELKRLMWVLGMRYDEFAEKQIAIDNLRGLRNRIAHGERVFVDPDRFGEFANWSVDFIDAIRSEFSTAVIERRYLR